MRLAAKTLVRRAKPAHRGRQDHRARKACKVFLGLRDSKVRRARKGHRVHPDQRAMPDRQAHRFDLCRRMAR